ncbi:MAG: hypothetical protein JXR03_07560 [Cyclobacteriaceae bacterium]
MSKSFDDIFKDRLSSLEKAPPLDAKKAVLGQVSTGSGAFVGDLYKALGALLLLISLYQVGKLREPVPNVSQVDHPAKAEDVQLNLAKASKKANAPEEPKKAEDKLYVASVQSRENETVLSNQNSKELPKNKKSYYLKEDIQVEKLDADLLETDKVRFNELSFLARNREDKRILPEKRKSVFPYFNTGAFFVYNRVRPNLSDDIYVGEYDAPFGMSPSRVGLALEGGLHKQLSDKLAVRGGLTFNNFNQSYSFTARSSRPDSVSVDKETGLLEPHFDKENVRINKRVSLVGAKGQVFWYVFPNHANVLFASFEYQYLLGSGPKFRYLDQQHSLMKPSQYLTEIGLRKLLMDRRRAGLFLMPSIRYAINKFKNQDIIAVKPFSVGVMLSYQLK